MADRLRLHLDESVNPAVARGLRRHGIDVTTTVDAGLRTAADEEQLRFAVRSGRVLVTHDDDFLRVVAAAPRHPGIAYCRPDALPVGRIIHWLRLMYEVLTPAEMVDRIEFLKDT